MDNFLEENPTGLFVCGGDHNHLDLERLSTMSGLKVLVDFLNRGSSILGNYLTNNENLFHKCYSVIFQMKTDHKCVVLPSGIKLKAVMITYKMHDYREHRKIVFQQKLLDYNWGYIKSNTAVDKVVNCLQYDLRRLIQQCFPTNTVRMSSRNLMWMTPLVKVLFKKRARLVARGVEGDSLIRLSARIGKIILENRIALASGKQWL